LFIILEYRIVHNDEQHNDSKYLIALGNRIKDLRLEQKISQTEIAYRCGFDKSNYNTIESGKRNPTILSLLKIAKALNVEVIDLFKF
jgi:putative transcriptional regulator